METYGVGLTSAEEAHNRIVKLEERLLSQTEKYMKQRCELVSFILVDLLPHLPVASREPLEKHLWRLLK